MEVLARTFEEELREKMICTRRADQGAAGEVSSIRAGLRRELL